MITYSIYKMNHLVIPNEVVSVVDLGYLYLSIETDFPEQLSSLPYRKKRNQDLPQEEIDYNIIHSKKRIIMVISSMTCSSFIHLEELSFTICSAQP